MQRLFIKEGSKCMMDTARCKAYETKILGEEYVTGYEYCYVPTEEQIHNHYGYIGWGSDFYST